MKDTPSNGWSGGGDGRSPLVSVIIPTRDRPRPLADAVGSALRQTYRNLEVWVIDDGSRTPVSLPSELARDDRLRLFRIEKSMGPGAARNIGAERSSGALLAWLDDDDQWLPYKLERQVSMLETQPECVAAVECGYEMVTDGRVILRYVPLERRELRRDVLKEAILCPSATAMRRSVFEALGGFDQSLKRMQDWELWIRFADSYQVASIPEIHVRRTAHRGSPQDLLRCRREILNRIGGRIERLPERERLELAAYHLFIEGVLLAEAEHQGEARAALWRAWRMHPRRFRPLLHVARTYTGERTWATARAILRPQWHRLVRWSGRDPTLQRW